MTHNRSERLIRDPARHFSDREDQAYFKEGSEITREERSDFEKREPESRDRESQIRRFSQLYGEFEPFHGTAPMVGATQGDDFGYTGPYAGRGPKGYKRSDERIKDEISEMLTRAPHIDASQLEVEVKDGEVTLTGTLSDRKIKFAAEECAARCLGVKDITNLIRIERVSSVSSRKSGSPTPSNPSH